MAQFISRVENQSDQYGTQSPGFGGFGGLLVSGPMLLVELTTQKFYLRRKAGYPMYNKLYDVLL